MRRRNYNGSYEQRLAKLGQLLVPYYATGKQLTITVSLNGQHYGSYDVAAKSEIQAIEVASEEAADMATTIMQLGDKETRVGVDVHVGQCSCRGVEQ